MGYDSNFADTIVSIYDTAVDQSKWQDALLRMAGHVGADGGLFLGFSWTGAWVAIQHATPSDAESDRIYREKWARNPWADRAVQQPVGAAFTSDDIIDQRALQRTEYYRDYLAPRDIEHGLFSCLAGSSDFMAGIIIHRGRRGGHFDGADLEVWRTFIPHLQRVAQIQLRLAEWNPLAALTSSALDRLTTGVILLDEQGDTVFVNAAARRVIEGRDALLLEGRQLSTASTRDRARLRRLILDALRTAGSEGGRGGGAMAVERPGGQLPVHLLVTPLAGMAAEALSCRGAAIFIRDRDSSSAPNIETIRQLFGLTLAEAKVAVLIAAGTGVPDAARALGVSVTTLKTHLAHAFAKTGTRRQSELAALIAELPGLVADEA